jgi:hypothetical protein
LATGGSRLWPVFVLNGIDGFRLVKMKSGIYERGKRSINARGKLEKYVCTFILTKKGTEKKR